MQRTFFEPKASENDVVLYTDEEPPFKPGDRIRVLTRTPVGHYLDALPEIVEFDG